MLHTCKHIRIIFYFDKDIVWLSSSNIAIKEGRQALTQKSSSHIGKSTPFTKILG